MTPLKEFQNPKKPLKCSIPNIYLFFKIHYTFPGTGHIFQFAQHHKTRRSRPKPNRQRTGRTFRPTAIFNIAGDVLIELSARPDQQKQHSAKVVKLYNATFTEIARRPCGESLLSSPRPRALHKGGFPE